MAKKQPSKVDPRPVLQFYSGGFELFVPPAPFSMPPEPPRFVMLDDLNNVFYEVAYDFPNLLNTTSWANLALQNVVDPAIVFPPTQWSFFEKHERERAIGNKAHEGMGAVGFLVSIESRENGVFSATKIGSVNIRPFPPNFMNWDVLGSTKGTELPAEMEAGLLRKVFDRRPGARTATLTYVTPRKKLENMPRPWHRNGHTLNSELDSRFVGAFRLRTGQQWKISVSE